MANVTAQQRESADPDRGHEAIRVPRLVQGANPDAPARIRRLDGQAVARVHRDVTAARGRALLVVEQVARQELVDGDLDARELFGIEGGARAGFTHVRLAITITGPETQERNTELRDVVDQHCPVLDLFVNATPVSATVTKG